MQNTEAINSVSASMSLHCMCMRTNDSNEPYLEIKYPNMAYLGLAKASLGDESRSLG